MTMADVAPRSLTMGPPLKIWLGLLLAALIAWTSPSSLALGAMNLPDPMLRAAIMVVTAISGFFLSRRIGLSVDAVRLKRPILTPILVAALVAAACATADSTMPGALHGAYHNAMTATPVVARIGVYVARAFNESILYRLFLGSLLAWLFGAVWKRPDGRPTSGAFSLAFVLSQLACIWINVTSLAPVTSYVLLHDALRYVAPGLVWSWLYWRYGFQTNEIACTSVHVFFQPLVTLGLS